ncbi:MAG TPA: glycine zipper 2TM domain-containing protein [Thiohalobacter sp.]|nr:glycine zipper 2TM domain-containing protein [Thiohalobacter sp.]
MNRIKQGFTALTLGAAALAAAPLAHADRYVEHNHYHDRDYGRDYARHDRGRGHAYGHHKPRKEVHHHYHQCSRCSYREPKRVIHEHYHHDRPSRVMVAPPRHYPAPRHSGYGGYRSATPMIVGGIIGGVLGNEMGKGRGRDAATVAGVLLGGSIGRDIGYRY